MWPVSGEYLQAILTPHRVTLRADVSKAGKRLFSDLPVTGGQIVVDAADRTISRRQCTLEIAPRLRTGTYTDVPALPLTPADPLAHYGQEVSVRHGLIYPNGVTEWVPVGVFRIDDVDGSLIDDGPVTVRGSSREADLEDDRFGNPLTVRNASAVQAITELIRHTLPDAEVVPATSRDRRVPRTIFERDRWDAIKTLAAGIGAVVFVDAAGRFVIRDAPTLNTPPVWDVTAGKNMVGANLSSSRDQVYNRCVTRGENPSSGEEPVTGEARDTNPTSPTYWAPASQGGYGRVTKFQMIPTITTQRQADNAAAADLARSTGAAQSVNLSSIPNPALEGLDVIDIRTDPGDVNSIRRHIIDRYVMDLAPGGRFEIETRDLGQAVASW